MFSSSARPRLLIQKRLETLKWRLAISIVFGILDPWEFDYLACLRGTASMNRRWVSALFLREMAHQDREYWYAPQQPRSGASLQGPARGACLNRRWGRGELCECVRAGGCCVLACSINAVHLVCTLQLYARATVLPRTYATTAVWTAQY